VIKNENNFAAHNGFVLGHYLFMGMVNATSICNIAVPFQEKDRRN
jgi:hypothetical protein